MALVRLLRCSARRILKTTPEPWRTSDGSVREDISAPSGPARGQCEARTSGRAVYRVGGGAVRSGDVYGYGGLRGVEGRAVAAHPSTGTRDSEPRYVQPGF